MGRTANIVCSRLERKEETGRAAAREDGAAVDLSVWAPPGETPKQAAARVVIRKRAVAWWAFNVEQDALKCLKDHPRHSKADVAAIEDCLHRVRACSYWEWHRGSRIMWFCLPEEWQALFRDGPKLFHKGPLPKGFT